MQHPLRILASFAVGSFVSTACERAATTSATSHAASAQPSGRDSAVYAALRDSLHPRPGSDTVVVAESSAVIAIAPETRARLKADSISLALLRALEDVSAASRPAVTLGLPFPARYMSRTKVDTLEAQQRFGPGRGPVAREWPATTYVHSFSPIVFSADGQRAVVYYGVSCGRAMCGRGQVLSLVRDTASGAWRIDRQIWGWVS